MLRLLILLYDVEIFKKESGSIHNKKKKKIKLSYSKSGGTLI